MSQLLLQVLIVVGFGALCFGFGYLTAFFVTRNRWRDEMITRRRPLQLADRQMGMGRAAERSEIFNARPALPAAVVCRRIPRCLLPRGIGIAHVSSIRGGLLPISGGSPSLAASSRYWTAKRHAREATSFSVEVRA